MAAYKTEIDVANRALQHLRVRRIRGFTDQSLAAQETAFAYPRLREAELKEHLWRFSTRRTMLYAIGPDTYLWTPPDYAAGTTYAQGDVVVDSNGDWWQAKHGSLVGTTPAQGDDWRHYYGPEVLVPFVAQAASTLATPDAPTLSATAGGGFGARTVVVKVTYVGADGESLASADTEIDLASNELVVVTSPAASTGATQYKVYAGQTSDGVVVQNSGTAINIGTDWTESVSGLSPDGAFPPNANQPAYYAGDIVSLGGTVYLSLVSNNSDVPPSVNWVDVGGTTAALKILYPIGAGPRNDARTANVYRLPHGYLRQAPTSPKAQTSTYLGAIRGNFREDWVFEGNYLVSTQAGTAPILMRYVADFVDVPDMDASFCEMLSARIAEEIGPILIADPTLLAPLLSNARKHYERERRDATAVNMIEVGPIDLELDDYIAARL